MGKRRGKKVRPNLYFVYGDRIFAQETNGHIFTLDAEDAYLLKERRFFTNSSNGYIEGRHNDKIERLHRLVMKAPKGTFVDHINQNKRDNRKCNLRFCTNSQNQANRTASKDSSTGFKGVYINSPSAKWKNPDKPYKSSIRVNGKSIHLGYFKSVFDAKKAYDDASLEYFGDFASGLV